MHIHEAKLILLRGLAVPEFAIGEFYERRRAELGYSKKVFWLSLVAALDLYDKDIEANIESLNSLGNSITDFSIPLLVETGGELKGSLGRAQIAYLQHKIFDLGEEYGLINRQPDIVNFFDEEKPGLPLLSTLLMELDFVNSNGIPRKNIKASEILGLAVAIKESHHNFLKSSYTDTELLKAFQLHLKIPVTSEVKRRGKGYSHFKEEAKKLIEKFMKSSRP